MWAWGIPLFGDGVGRKRRVSVDFGFELGLHEANIGYDYQTANLLSQRVSVQLLQVKIMRQQFLLLLPHYYLIALALSCSSITAPDIFCLPVMLSVGPLLLLALQFVLSCMPAAANWLLRLLWRLPKHVELMQLAAAFFCNFLLQLSTFLLQLAVWLLRTRAAG